MATIKCPECAREMRYDRSETTHDAKKNSYNATYYKCKYDNTWVTVEVLKEKKEK